MKKIFVAYFHYDFGGGFAKAGIIGASTNKDLLQKKVEDFKKSFIDHYELTDNGYDDYETEDGDPVIFKVLIEEFDEYETEDGDLVTFNVLNKEVKLD